MEVSLLTSGCTLVPSNFFDPASSRELLAGVSELKDDDVVEHVEIPWYDAVLVYSRPADEAASSYILNSDISGEDKSFPEMFYILRDLQKCTEYNKILCTWRNGLLFLGVAQGRSLLMANVFKAADFNTAMYYVFLAMKSFQLNPEVSTICWTHPLDQDCQLTLYRYFKAVETL